MKSIYTTAILCLFGISAFTQDSTMVDRKELSININNFVAQYLSFSDTNSSISDPYTIMLHAPIEGFDAYLRLGLGIDVNYNNEKNEFDGMTTDERSNSGLSTDFRFGYEYRKMLNSRFRMHYGQDFLLNLNYFNSTSDQNSSFESKGQGFGLGLGPVLGLSFLFNDRISIWTEASLYVTYSRFSQESSFNDQSLDTQISNNVLVNINEPLSIYLKIKL